MTKKIRLLISDDHPVVRAGIVGMLSGEKDFEVLGEAKDGSEAVALADRTKPDVVLMDLRMPEMDGVEAISRIKERHPEINILVLTTYESDADVLRALERGGDRLHAKGRAARRPVRGHSGDVPRKNPPCPPDVAARLIQRGKRARGRTTEHAGDRDPRTGSRGARATKK